MAKGQIPENAYSREERLAALELSVAIGPQAAADNLKIARANIYRWRSMYPQEYSDLLAGDESSQKKGYAKRLDALADAYTEAEFDALQRAEDLISHADPKELAALIKAMGSSRQAAIGGARTVLGESETVEHNINFPQLEQAMKLMLERAEAPLQVPNEAIQELTGGDE